MPLPSKNPEVVFRRVTDGAVLLSTEDEVYFGLNEVGALIWELLTPEVESFEQLRDAVSAKFPDVDSETITADLEEILAELKKAGMLEAQ